MRTKTVLQQKIAALTNNGDDILRFLAETMRGEIPGAKACHRMEAARHLMRLDSSDEREDSDQVETRFWGLIPTPEELAAEKNTPPFSTDEGTESPISPQFTRHSCGGRNPEGQGGATDNSKLTTENSPVTHLDILNYEVAHLIRSETADGHTIVEFLAGVMNSRDKPYTPKRLRIRQTDRMAAAREIMRRGFGHFGRRRKLVHDDYEANDYDTLHTDLAKRMREYSEHGADVIRFLLDVMSDTSLDPEEAYTWHHRTSAAMELLRRGWDTNYDKITPEMLQAYWRDQQSSRLSVGQKKQLAGLPTFTDEYDQYDNTDYQAIAKEIRESEARENASAPGNSPLSPGERVRVRGNAPVSSSPQNSEAIANRHSRENGNPAASRNPLSLGERARVRGTENTTHPSTAQRSDVAEHDTTSSPSCTSMLVLPDDLDCYYEPLTPEDQAIFNYQSLIESGEFEEGEITFVPPSRSSPPRLRHRPQADKTSRRSRRHPRPPQPPRRNIPPSGNPQPITHLHQPVIPAEAGIQWSRVGRKIPPPHGRGLETCPCEGRG